jgi:hypothetical protein
MYEYLFRFEARLKIARHDTPKLGKVPFALPLDESGENALKQCFEAFLHAGNRGLRVIRASY